MLDRCPPGGPLQERAGFTQRMTPLETPSSGWRRAEFVERARVVAHGMLGEGVDEAPHRVGLEASPTIRPGPPA